MPKNFKKPPFSKVLLTFALWLLKKDMLDLRRIAVGIKLIAERELGGGAFE